MALFLVGVMVTSIAIITAPHTPWWGSRHTFDVSKGAIRLNPDKSIEQTLTSEAAWLDTIVLWLDPTRLPAVGQLTMRVSGADSSDVTMALADIPPSGTAIFSLPQPLYVGASAPVTLAVHLNSTRQPVYMPFQIDGTIYPDGELQHRAGDLGFQVRYARPPLGTRGLHWLAGLLLAAAGLGTAWVLRLTLQQSALVSWPRRQDIVVALLTGLATAAWYGANIIRAGTWISPGDFVKDVAYVQASVEALKNGAWPVWSHLICGGLPLLANPESNTLSLATLFGLVMPSEHALLTLLALEAGMAAAGTYVLARSFKVTPLGSVLAAAVAALSPAYAYRIGEGFSMTGAAVAFTPWVLLGFFQAIQNQRWWGALVAGASLGLIFWRGEVHILVGVILLLGLWTILATMRQRSSQALRVLLAIAAITVVVASPKLLAYAEHHTLFTSQLKPYVVRLWETGLLDDIFFTAPDRSVKVPVRYGTEEHWGNFGSYTGWLPWILAVVGLASPVRWRWWLLAGTASLLLLAEGTFFDYALRPLGPLGVLLRLPTRVLSIFLVLLGILAGSGVTIFQHIGSWPSRLLAVVVTTAIIIDLGMTTGPLLRHSFSHHSLLRASPPPTAQLADHQNISENSSRHPALLLKSNYLLPNLCADLNIDHPFTANQPETYPLASVPTHIVPNGIILHDAPPASDVYVNENFMSAWVVDHGVVLQSPTKALHIVTLPEAHPILRLRVVSGLAVSQALLLMVILATTLGVGVGLFSYRLRVASRAKPAPGPDHSRS